MNQKFQIDVDTSNRKITFQNNTGLECIISEKRREREPFKITSIPSGSLAIAELATTFDLKNYCISFEEKKDESTNS